MHQGLYGAVHESSYSKQPQDARGTFYIRIFLAIFEEIHVNFLVSTCSSGLGAFGQKQPPKRAFRINNDAKDLIFRPLNLDRQTDQDPNPHPHPHPYP